MTDMQRVSRCIRAGLLTVVCLAGATQAQQSRVFVSSTGQTPDFGGLAGGDAICQRLADAQTLGGTWVAWLSTSSVDAKDRLTASGPFVRATDTATKIADDLADLTDGTLDNPILKDEKGVSDTRGVYTGTNQNGTADATNNCSDWSSTSGNGTLGAPDFTSQSWTDTGAYSCDSSQTLYCFEQAATVPTAPPTGLVLLALLLIIGCSGYLYRRRSAT